jgi:glycogen debranching enzyme
MSFRTLLTPFALGFALASPLLAQSNCANSGGMTLTRAARDGQFLDAVSPRAGLLGREDGIFEAWIYPLKLFRDFSLKFRVGDKVLEGNVLPRTITVRPESVSVHYIYDSFTACATWFAPINERGAIVTIEVSGFDPVAVEASFVPDVAWMWPAGMGDGYGQWDAQLKAFRFSNDRHAFFAIAGAANASAPTTTYSANYSAEHSDVIWFGPAAKGKTTYRFVMAASFESQQQANALYHKLLADDSSLENEAREYYSRYLDSTVKLSLPDRNLQLAYDWSRVSTLQGLVDEPYAGKGLVAGYNISSGSHRPGFSWYFGRDSIWTSLALNAIGDFTTTRTALEFLMRYQRPDGKIPHEIAQTVKLIDWWKDYPYGTASADGTPLFLVGFDDYVRSSGDVSFARDHWDSLWQAYQYLKSTYGTNGLSKNLHVGHGWIEGGPLRFIPGQQPGVAEGELSGELYQAGVGVAGVEALANLARAVGKSDIAQTLDHEATAQRATIETLFWSPQTNSYGYALDSAGKLIDKPSVLGTVPMWFGELDQHKSDLFLNQIAGPAHQADWGMRITSQQDPLYSPTGYHFGSVWPLFTGWASIAGYRYHRPLYGYANLMANAQLAHDGSPGRVTEVLSGDYYTQLSTSTPHQIWSSAMVVTPLMRGLLGLEVNALKSSVVLAPHVPAGWNDFAIHNVKVEGSQLDFTFHRAGDDMTLEVQRHGKDNVQLEFSPALSLRAKVADATVDGKKVSLRISANENDQHATVSASIASDTTTIRLHVTGDFGIAYPFAAPADGAPSSNLRVVSEVWNDAHDKLQLHVEGISGSTYEVPVFNVPVPFMVHGALLVERESLQFLEIQFRKGPPDTYIPMTLTLEFPAQ